MPRRAALFKKYALIFSVLIACSLLLSGLLGISYSYQENKRALISLQREKADAAASRIGQYLFDIEQHIAVTSFSRGNLSALEQRSQDIQYLRRTPAISEITLLDPQGKEFLRVSRRAVDVVRSGRDFSTLDAFLRVKSGRPYRSPIYFREGGLYMTTAMAVGPVEAGITVVEVDLEFLLSGISRIKVGEFGHAYAVDTEGRLIAHPDIGLVLKNTNLAKLPQVQTAIKGSAPASQELEHAISLGGKEVLSAFGTIPQLGWFVFVEEPLTEAYRPLYIQAIRSALLVLLGMLFTLLVSVTLVRRMLYPIDALQEGVALIGQGKLEHRISVNTGDELEDLANGFNRMASQLQDSYATLEQRVEQRTRELETLNYKLAALSTTDALTGIANRRRFDEVLSSEWSRATRTGQPLALAMLDVDWFKLYNDRYGHLAGDDCLRQVASVLQSTVSRTSDLVARYGGEEFVFLAPDTDIESALNMARKLGEAVQALAMPHELSEFGCVTISIGVAALTPDTGNSPAWLVKAADETMYVAKNRGRNQVVMAKA